MNPLPLLAAAAEGGQFEQIAQQFGVTWQLLISQTILFVIVALALKKFAYAPILEMLEERKRRIAESLANAEKIKADLASAQAKAQDILNQASAQATKVIEESRAAAARVAEQERQKAISDAQQILAKAREAGEAELVRVKSELRKEFGRLVVQASMQATGKILTPADQQRLAEDTNRQLAA